MKNKLKKIHTTSIIKYQNKMRKTTNFVIILAFFAITTACGDSPNQPNQPVDIVENSEEGPTEITPEAEAETSTQPQKVALICNDLGEGEYGTPQAEVFLDIDGNKIKVGTIAACSAIPAEDYTQHEIPTNAVAACGGWWAGAGDYFYAIIENNEVAVYRGAIDESEESTGYHWEKIELKELN